MRRFLQNRDLLLFRTKQIFRAYNLKIIFYFIFFGYLPLLVFSFLGYYVNKDVITRVNEVNLHSTNRSFTREIEAYLQLKYRLLEAAFSEPVTPFSHENLTLLHGEFAGVGREFAGYEDTIYFTKHFSVLPYVRFKSGGNTTYKGYLDLAEIESLVKGEDPQVEREIIIPEINLKISSFDSPGTPGIAEFGDPETISDQHSQFDRTGSEFFRSSAAIPQFGFTIVTIIDAGSFYAQLDDFRYKIILANVILAMIVFILAIAYSRQITTPIHKLIAAIQHIGSGNLEKRIEIHTNDEIEILANEFEIMRQKLFESYQGMEEKIQARTRQLQEAQAQISHQEKMASLGLMAAGIAHEIGNPLTSISSLAQVIKRKTNDERILEHLNNILKGIERISRIVRELVDFSKPSTYKAAYMNINEIINSAVGIVKYDRRSKHITYELDLDQTVPKTIIVSDHLLQVLLNILINAVDASEGYGNIIKVLSYNQNGSIHIDIEDNGCGIPQDKLNKIFEPFYTTKEVGKGTGLGLTVSYGLIKKMNGEIRVKSRLKKGSIFTVILPVKDETED